MDDWSEIPIRKACCTCLSVDRELSKLCLISDGINMLYMLLTQDPEAFKEGFYKDTTNLYVCWECKAVFNKIKLFRRQMWTALKQLDSVIDGRTCNKTPCLSSLKIHTTKYIEHVTYDDNFIDCGSPKETDFDSDDIPLSKFVEQFQNFENEDFDSNSFSEFKPYVLNDKDYNGMNSLDTKLMNTDFENHENHEIDLTNTQKQNKSDLNTNILVEDINLIHKSTATSKNKLKNKKHKSCFTINVISEEELLNSLEEKRGMLSGFKCEPCLIEFKDENALETHNLKFHTKDSNKEKCDICSSYISDTDFKAHRSSHFKIYTCILCKYTTNEYKDIVTHCKEIHGDGKKKKKNKHTSIKKELKYPRPCPECNLVLKNKKAKWKHFQKMHKEGHKCSFCEKKFAFKSNLQRHENAVHVSPPGRVQCTSCPAAVRADLLRAHARTHRHRDARTCVPCDKTFVCTATYNTHLKYAKAHAAGDVYRYKCPSCDKKYRSQGELRDHENYQHKNQTQHKCPICDKALATRRCIKRHVKRAHEGIKENAKDKICQRCGKAFRDKKSLREHEYIHSGLRPLSCEICGRSFRQTAALYTHRRRVHRLGAPQRTITVIDT